ncbi:TPA: phage tail protein [Burkholderia vietnamiensis]|nr:phage tail protein [Burkholderia vietnamiensis]
MSVTAASATATLTADEIVVGTALGGQKYVLGAFSKTINLAATGAGGMDTGSAPASGYVALYAIYNPTTGASALLATNATSAVAPNVYGGANLPSGYTASALVSVWPTNGSRQFVVAYQVDRSISIANNTIFTNSTTTSGYVSVSIAGAVPPNAKAFSGGLQANTSVAAALQFGVAATSAPVGIIGMIFNSAGNQSSSIPFVKVPISAPQTTYYNATNSTGTPTFTLIVSSYDF